MHAFRIFALTEIKKLLFYVHNFFFFTTNWCVTSFMSHTHACVHARVYACVQDLSFTEIYRRKAWILDKIKASNTKLGVFSGY